MILTLCFFTLSYTQQFLYSRSLLSFSCNHSAMSLPPQPRGVRRKIWQTCAGPGVKIPKLNSIVYYFPKGHLEHACSSPDAATASFLYDLYSSSYLCIISAVDLLADPHTDEVFAKLILTPVAIDGGVQVQEPAPPMVPDEEDKDGNIVSYVKTLSQSDSNNTFSVPRDCARLIFPNFNNPMPSQELSLTDVQGRVWKYNYTFRKNPDRYRFSTGWTSFRDDKKLVADDSVVFMKNSAGELSVGIRRHMKKEGEEGGWKREKLTESVVFEAVKFAEENTAFEVVYYPSHNWSDFVVDAKTVDDAMRIVWNSGMRVKLLLKTDESSNSNMKNVQSLGTISNVSNPSSKSPNWRILQVLAYVIMFTVFTKVEYIIRLFV